ncbi:hypothetical protein ACS0PU_006887 [Formica fusca]
MHCNHAVRSHVVKQANEENVYLQIVFGCLCQFEDLPQILKDSLLSTMETPATNCSMQFSVLDKLESTFSSNGVYMILKS